MRRLAALVLVHAMVLAPATAFSLHVHEYHGHDHPEHHHGPASHQHHPAAAAGHDDHHADRETPHGPAIAPASCDPGRHAVSVGVSCADVRHVHVDLAEAPGPVVRVRRVVVRTATPVTDVRAHGPPFDPQIPSRAPPAIPHA